MPRVVKWLVGLWSMVGATSLDSLLTPLLSKFIGLSWQYQSYTGGLSPSATAGLLFNCATLSYFDLPSKTAEIDSQLSAISGS